MSNLKRRRIILGAAERLIIHYGVSKTTVSDIAKEARVGVGTVYLEFKSKDDIVAKIVGERHRSILEAMRVAGHEGANYAQRFRNMMSARVFAFVEYAGPGAHASELIHCHSCQAVAELFQQFGNKQIDVIADLLAAGLGAGEFTINNPEQTARTVLRAYRVFSPPAIYDERWTSMEAELDEMHQLVIGGLKGA